MKKMKKFLVPTMAVVALVGAGGSVLAEETVLENTEETVAEENKLLRASDLIDKDNLSMQEIMDKIVDDFQTNGSDSLIIKDLIDTIKDYPSLQLDLTMKFLYATNSIFGNYLGDLVEELGSDNIEVIGDAITDYLAEQKEVLSADDYTELYTRVNEVTFQLYNELVKHVDHENLTQSEYDTFKTASEFEYLSQTSLEELQLGFDENESDIKNEAEAEGGQEVIEEEIIEENSNDGSEENNSEENKGEVTEDSAFDSEEEAPEGAICGDSDESVSNVAEESVTLTESENCVENSDGKDLIVDGETQTEDITTVIVPNENSSLVTVTDVSTESLPQTGMDSSSSTTGGLIAMMLGLLTFGLYSRKKSLNN